jgi:hypothetical protein
LSFFPTNMNYISIEKLETLHIWHGYFVFHLRNVYV